MKKILIIALIALVVVTGGMFAYTFTTATATIGVVAPTSDFANVTAGGNITAPTVFGKFTGTWPSNTLYEITPDASYTGDLVIKVYMVNTGQLIRQYQHINMTLEFQDSTNSTADEQGVIQVLNLQNAETLFTWSNGTGTGPYKVQLTGGGYRLHPFKTLTGGSYQPQIWCEITQR
ncbi:MAG: hypothetical protein V3W44_01100 [Dehalococcoidales bacterium]